MVYAFLADGFEEVEAITPIDLLRRAEIPVTTVGIGKLAIHGAHDITVLADTDTSVFSTLPDDAEMILLPGGMPGTLNLEHSPTVQAAIKAATERGLYLAAICAAPSILGHLGLLAGKRATCFPGFEDQLAGAAPSDEGVVWDGKIITARAMGPAHEFGFTLIRALRGKECADRIRASVYFD